MKTGTLIGQFTDTIEYEVDDFLANGIVTTSIVVSYTKRKTSLSREKYFAKSNLTGIFLAGDELFGMEKLTISTSSYFI